MVPSDPGSLGCARMEREKAWPDTAAPPGRREGESLTSESGGIEYRSGGPDGGSAETGGEGQGGGGQYRPAVGGPVCDTVAPSAGTESRREHAGTKPGDPSGVFGVACAG